MSKFTWSAGLLSLLVASSLSAQATQPKTESKKAVAAPAASKPAMAPATAVQAKPKDTTRTTKVAHKDTKAPRHEDGTKATADQMKKAQQALADKGLYKGKVTGRTNAAFRAALKQYQKDNQLKPTGRLNQETMAKLNIM